MSGNWDLPQGHAADLCSYTYPLFEHMSHAHDLTLLDSELQDIIAVVQKMNTRAPHPDTIHAKDFEMMLRRLVRAFLKVPYDWEVLLKAKDLLERKGTASPLREEK